MSVCLLIQRRILVLIAVMLFFVVPIYSYECDVVSGDRNSKRIKIGFFAEGYTEAEREKYNQDVQRLVDTIFSISPFKEYRDFFTVFRTWTPSSFSGIPSFTPENTYFQGVYSGNLLMIINSNGLWKIMADTSLFGKDGLRIFDDIPIVLFNKEERSGISDAVEILITRGCQGHTLAHEIGHLLGELGDEYEASYIGSVSEKPNVTASTDPDKIPWRCWIDSQTPLPTPESTDYEGVVGLFEGANYHTEGWYRPMLRCKMNSLDAPFCDICREQLVYSIVKNLNPITVVHGVSISTRMITSVSRLPGEISSGTITVDYPECELQLKQWLLDGQKIECTGKTLDLAQVQSGGVIEFVIKDTSGYIRNPNIVPFLNESVKWHYTPEQSYVKKDPRLRVKNLIQEMQPGLFYIPLADYGKSAAIVDLSGNVVYRQDIRNQYLDLRRCCGFGTYILSVGNKKVKFVSKSQ